MHLALPSNKVLTIAGSVTALTVTVSLIKLYFRRKRNQKVKSYPKDVVILHQFPPHTSVPSMSPFCIKLETWLRMANIKYENDFSYLERSPKGQTPWITLNGVNVSDSQFSIEYLTNYFGKDLSDHLNLVEKSIARAFFKLTENSLHWCMVYSRMAKGKASDMGMPAFVFFLIKRKMMDVLKKQGYGRHSYEEVMQIAKADLKALEDFILNKKFLFGESPCVEDAIVFSLICQFVYVDKGELNKYVTEQCPNLMRHLQTMKDAYWKDWDLCLKK